MPPKKKNKANGFYMYMLDKKRGFELECGKNLTMGEMVALAHPGWKLLSDADKLFYNGRAKDHVKGQKYEQADSGKMDCTGQLLTDRVDLMAITDSKRSNERRQLVEKWPVGHAVCMEKFYMIAFDTLCELPDDGGFLPCEVACVSYSLYAGILDVFHRFLDPGRLPIGFRYICQSKSDNYHKIPVEDFELATNNYRQVWSDLCDFVNPQSDSVFPPVFCQFRRRNEVHGCLRWLSDHAGITNRLSKVYEMEVLVCELFVHARCSPPSHSACTDLLTTSAFDYESDTRCKYHEDNEVPMDYCALGKAKKNCYCLSDSLASTYNLELTANHLPERQDVSSCLVIQPSMFGIQFADTKQPQRRQKQDRRQQRQQQQQPPHQPHQPQQQFKSGAPSAWGRGPPSEGRQPQVKRVAEKPEVKEEPLRRPTSVSMSGLLAAKQIQPMKDREMGTRMAMLAPRPGVSSPVSRFALPESAPPPSSLPLPTNSWQGIQPADQQDDFLEDEMRNNYKVTTTTGKGVGLGRGLGRGILRHPAAN